MPLRETYIDPNVAAGGDGSSGNPYSTWSEWDTNEQTDLTTNDDTHILYCRSGQDTVAVQINAWVTSPTNTVTIKADPGHEHLGVLGVGFRKHSLNNFTPSVRIDSNYFTIEDITIENCFGHTVGLDVRGPNTVLNRIIFDGELLITDNAAIAQTYGSGDQVNFPRFNACLFVRAKQQGLLVHQYHTAKVYNCTFVGGVTCGMEVIGISEDVHAYNTVAYGNTPDYNSNARFKGDYAAAGDGTAPGTNAIQAIVAGDFTDYDNADYTIAGTGSQLYNAGSATYLPPLDITRQPFTTNDIGCFAYIDSGGPVEHQVNLADALGAGADIAVPTVDAVGDTIVTLADALGAGADIAVPTIVAPATTHVLLQNAISAAANIAVPDVDAVIYHQVDLETALSAGADIAITEVQSGGDVIVTLDNALNASAAMQIPVVDTELTHFVNLGDAIGAGADIAITTVEGVPDLPPSITVPTQDQIYTFSESGVLPAPPYDLGTGTNPQWSLPVDGFGGQPGVTTWSIDVNTGAITYAIAMLTTDANVQALNTKGPYTVTRRIATSKGNDDETFDVMVNVGNYTLQFTPGTKLETWNTVTAAARGVEAAMDPSPRVTQLYTVT